MSIITQNKSNHLADLESKKDLIKRMYCKGASDDEFEVFLHACKRTGLDPTAKQIYAIKRGNQLTIQTGIDGFRLIADRSGNYSPGKEATFTYDEKTRLHSATAYIKKRTPDGTWHEVSATAYMDEYDSKQNLWVKMPRAMLSKCAESLALRKAFPAELSGIYTSEEMSQADIPSENPENLPLSEDQLVNLDIALQEIDDDEAIKKITDFLKVPTIHSIIQKDYARTMRALQKRIDSKEKTDEPSAVA